MAENDNTRCPICNEQREIVANNFSSIGAVVTFDCKHSGRINPARGTVVNEYEKDGKVMQKVDNRMYLPVDEDPELIKHRESLAAKEAEIDALEKKLAALELSKKEPKAQKNDTSTNAA